MIVMLGRGSPALSEGEVRQTMAGTYYQPITALTVDRLCVAEKYSIQLQLASGTPGCLQYAREYMPSSSS